MRSTSSKALAQLSDGKLRIERAKLESWMKHEAGWAERRVYVAKLRQLADVIDAQVARGVQLRLSDD